MIPNMGKKNDRKLCWSCEGKVELSCEKCPYCGTDLGATANGMKIGANSGSGIPGSVTASSFAAPYSMASTALDEPPPPPPYAGFSGGSNYTPSNKEWEEAFRGDSRDPTPLAKQEESVPKEKQEMLALILLLPGIVFFLFGIALLLFSQEGVFTLRWHQNFSYFYFLGALPLLYLGYKALK